MSVIGFLIGIWVVLILVLVAVIILVTKLSLKSKKVIHTSLEKEKPVRIKDNKVSFSTPVIPQDEFDKSDDIGDFIKRIQ